MMHRAFTLLILLALLTIPGEARNVILLTVDSCRADRFGFAGNDPSPTPHLDAWARQGALFENAYSTSVWTAPGVVSVLSGLYPPIHAVNNRDHTGSPDLVTLPKLMSAKGYRVPNLNFFTFAPYYRHLGLPEVQREYFGPQPGDELINWLEKHGGNQTDKPFFIWYHSTLVHQPYNPPAEYLPKPRESYLSNPALKAVMTGAIVPVGSARFQPDDRAELLQLYDGQLKQFDNLFSRLLKTLEQSGLMQDTLIVLTADHGEELLDHGYVGHASTSLQAKLYEELVRIPLVFSWPGKVTAQRNKVRASQIDILPSILALLGDFSTVDVDGVDLFGGTDIGQRPLFFESVISGNQTTREHEGIWVRAVLQDRYKFVSTEELYDLEKDPSEERNVIDQQPEIADQLRARLSKWQATARERRSRLFPYPPQIYAPVETGSCPTIQTPGDGEVLQYDQHTGTILIDWTGDKKSSYLVQYDIGTGDHHISGIFEVDGNHQLLGPLNRELWTNLKAWNPFKIRVAPKSATPCWSSWVSFRF